MVADLARLTQEVKPHVQGLNEVGDRDQELKLITRHGDDYREETLLPVRFVPMTGEARRR